MTLKPKRIYAMLIAAVTAAAILVITYGGPSFHNEPLWRGMQKQLRFRAYGLSNSSELDELFSEHRASIPISATSCPGYWEFRGVNFQHPALAELLCKNQVAYTLIDQKYPPCEISEALAPQLLSRLNRTAVRTFIKSALTGRTIMIYTYPVGDIVSETVIWSHNWEKAQVAFTLSIAKKFPAGSVTFMDIGCNIGVYTLQAREADLPTVAVDANIRNHIRIRMSANDMGWLSDPKLKLMWVYFHQSVSLQYLNFDSANCNVGGAKSSKDVITDTIPVMTGKADDLLSSVATDLVVMKIDIETSEHIFFSTGERLFSEKKIIAVQMEFWRPDASKPASASPSFAKIVKFFTKRHYTLFQIGDLKHPVDLTGAVRLWDGIWVRNDYLNKLL